MINYRVTKQGSDFGLFGTYDSAYVAILIDARECGVPSREYNIFTISGRRS